MALSTVEDICNAALRKIGYAVPIGYIYEGSAASRVAVEIYGQTRDALLTAFDWDFARQAVKLTLLKTAPVGGYQTATWTSAYPPPPWVYEYAYPAACLLVRALRPTPIFMPEFDPVPSVFVLGNDAGAEVILTNLANAQAVYTAQVVTPTVWSASFTEGLIDALAVKFQKALAPEPNAVKDAEQTEAQSVAMAVERRG